MSTGKIFVFYGKDIIEDMTEDELLNSCITALTVMNEIVDIVLDNENYAYKEDAYDGILNILIKHDVVKSER